MSSWPGLGLVLGVALGMAVSPALAQEAASGQASADAALPTVTATEAARRLMDAGRVAEAKALLELQLKADPGNSQALLLYGLIAVAEGRLGEAVDLFNRILVRNPADIRARLELGRAYFLQGERANAERQFRLARAGKPPEAVIANIDLYLDRLRQARLWSAYVGLTLAPDSNVNGATSAKDVEIYGLPFQLSDAARQQSGVGVSVDAGAEGAPAIGPTMRLRLGVQGRWTDYPGGAFDDGVATVYAGPRWAGRKGWISAVATGYGRQFGGRTYARAPGVRLEGAYAPDARSQWNLSLATQDMRFALAPGQNGQATGLDVAYMRATSPVSLMRSSVSAFRQEAQDPAYAFTAVDAAVGYSRELKGGWSVYVEPGLGRSDFDAFQPAFGVKHRDERWRLRVDVTSRRLRLSGFMPRISYVYSVQNSNVALYDYHRSQAQFALTRQF